MRSNNFDSWGLIFLLEENLVVFLVPNHFGDIVFCNRIFGGFELFEIKLDRMVGDAIPGGYTNF